MKTKYDKYGALHVDKNGKLVDRTGEVVQLKGYSTHALSWYPEYVNRDFIEYMKDNWNIDCLRLAMYTAEEDGYCVGDDANRKKLLEVVDRGVRFATELGLYVIIDWHILSDSNPLMHEDLAADFFETVSSRFASYGNVFYELCNEPNVDCTWDDVKKYASRIIPIIRANDPYAVILVGTPKWSQRLDEAAASPIDIDDNLMYTLHFYANTHMDELRQIYKDAMAAKLPVLEGKSDAATLMLDENNTSYMMWNISNRDETSASFVPECDNCTGPYEAKDLREPAQWYVNWLGGKI